MKPHTPGPWEQHGQHVWGPHSVTVAYCGCNMSSEASGSYSIGADEAVANARLITAAPLLLTALTELHALVKGECPSLLDEDSGGNWSLAIAIEEAIAHATEES